MTVRFGTCRRDWDVTTTMAIADATDLAYEQTFQDHWTDVFRFALAWTNDWAAAEDLAQEAFLRLWDHRRAIDWNETVLPWLLVATRRLATDRFRQLRRRLTSRSALMGGPSLDPAVHARWLDVAAAMNALSPLERSALVLTTLEGHTYDEAAVALGTTAGALRAAVSRARAKLENA
jgi:RNA polymerase sigma-70 factor, ECF subfamily